MGHDGTQGIKAIKAAGGFVIAQSIKSSESESMPSSAIATGIIDEILAPNEMAQKIINYANSNIKAQTIIPIVTYDEEILKKYSYYYKVKLATIFQCTSQVQWDEELSVVWL